MKRLSTLLYTTEEGRRVYPIEPVVNNRNLSELIIDPHYELKHSDYINDELIYNLVLTLDSKRFVPKIKYLPLIRKMSF